MRLIRGIILLAVLAGAVFYIVKQTDLASDHSDADLSHTLEQNETKLKAKEVPDQRATSALEGDVYQWMNKTADALEEHFGDPIRKDMGPYGNERWVYTDEEKRYIQFGLDDNEVQSIYALGDDLAINPVEIGQAYEDVDDALDFSQKVTYSTGMSSYTFHLNKDDLQERPLVKVADDTFLQLYFDTSTDELSAVRLLSADMLLMHQPYKVQYRGELPEEPTFTEDEWEQIEEGAQQQIFYLTNVIRNQHGKSALKWDDSVSKVAYKHSKDMAQNDYFSHKGQNGDGLKERLAAENVVYQTAGENIAAQYPDAESALHGWINSEEHRQALLNDDFTHIGSGVYQFYYTQNFLKQE